jgi:2-oxoglutarate ferredoxin oxidoreductase subunit gamma
MLPATALASELGDVKMTNMVLFGALLALRPLVAMDTVQHVLHEKLGARRAHLLAINLAALDRGMAIGLEQKTSV